LIPHALSSVRLVLAYPFFLSMRAEGFGEALLGAVFFGIAVGTDLLDGRLARRFGTASARGRALDHTADFVFVVAGLAGAALRGALPMALPILVTLAFAQYAVDSLLIHRSGELRMSSLGRWNGVLYFVPLGGDLLVRLGLSWLALAVRLVSWGLVLTTTLSMAERARAVARSRRGIP
jgi:CDP-diacylglycerol--glycerol-3-phosphate 3-phosphatidyltransferase